MNMEIILKRILMDCPAYCDSYMRRADSALYLLLTNGIVSFALQKKEQYSMLAPAELATFFGFTEEEVSALCHQKSISFSLLQEWYDGYLLNGTHILKCFWKNTLSVNCHFHLVAL